MTTKKKSPKEEDAVKPPPAKKAGGAAAAAEKLLSDETPQSKIAEHGETMMEGPRTAATQSARVLSEVIAEKPELVVPLVAKFAKGISSSNKRVVQTSAEALPAIARIAPARVARQLDVLKGSFEEANDVVAKIANGAARKARQSGHGGGAKPGEFGLQDVEHVFSTVVPARNVRLNVESEGNVES